MKELRFGDPAASAAEPWIITASGVRLHPFNPQLDEISFEDAARALSRKCRFSGNMSDKYPDSIYSVAQHSVYVTKLIKQPEARKWGILHDVPEVPFGDIVSPVKVRFPDYREAEERFAAFLRKSYDVPFDDEIARIVDEADYEMFLRESTELMAGDSEHFGRKEPSGTIWDVDPDFYPWSPKEARDRFLEAVDEIFWD